MRDAKTSEDVQPHTEEMELRTLASLYCQISLGSRIHRRQSEQSESFQVTLYEGAGAILESQCVTHMLHEAFYVTRNAAFSLHPHQLAQHSKHEEKHQLKRFRASLGTSSLFSCPKL